MKFVYIVFEGRDYEDDIIDGVFTSEKAVKDFYNISDDDVAGSFDYGSFDGMTVSGCRTSLGVRKVPITGDAP